MTPHLLASDRAASSRRLWRPPARPTLRALLAAPAAVLTASGLVVALAAGAAPTASAAPAPAATTTPSAAVTNGDGAEARRAGLTRLARNLVAAGAPGVIVRVSDGRGPAVEIVEQAPWARRSHRLEAGDEYRMASNTKTMMATITLQLVAEGRLALNDPVEKWLPGAVPSGGAMTLRMLLNHTSGLFDYPEDPSLRPSITGRDPHRWTSAELLAVGARHPLLFAPGTRFAYSNTDYAAVGAVLEKATGRTLADLVRDRIARPLHLEHTYLATDSRWHGRYARGYEPDLAHMPSGVPVEFRDVAGPHVAGHVDVSGNDPSYAGAAGGIVSTARDWSRFYTALMSGGLLPPAQLKQMLTTVPMDPANPKDGPGSGMGIVTGSTPCGRVWAHEGGMTGYSSINYTDATGRRTASVLIPTELLSEFDADQKLTEADQALSIATACAMFGKPVPATR